MLCKSAINVMDISQSDGGEIDLPQCYDLMSEFETES